jgi:hypothetical protein
VKNNLHPKVATSGPGTPGRYHGQVHHRIIRDQGEACREAHTGYRPDDRDLTVFERLAERLADRPRELGQLVEEEHTPVLKRLRPGR